MHLSEASQTNAVNNLILSVKEEIIWSLDFQPLIKTK